MSGEIDVIRTYAIGVPSGTNVGGLSCPFCNGGRTGEKSLSIKQERGSILYVCHRARCGVTGRIGSSYSVALTDKRKPEFNPKIYTGTFQDIPDVYLDYYLAKYPGFSESSLKRACRWSPEYQRTVWPINSAIGALRGYELRSHRPEDRAKTLHFRHTAGTWQCHCPPYRTDAGPATRTYDGAVVLVEDVISAVRVADAGFYCVSLMGSNLNLDNLMDLPVNAETIILALDKDATNKTLAYCKKFGLLFDIEPRILDQDLKYLTDVEIGGVIKC